jgi:hypothetical protein
MAKPWTGGQLVKVLGKMELAGGKSEMPGAETTGREEA